MNLSIIIPAYNEMGNLPLVLDDLDAIRQKMDGETEIIVVDDGSTDGTRDYLERQKDKRPWLRISLSERNAGMGASLKVGTLLATHPLVAWVMADRSDRLEDLLSMKHILEQGADLVIASRAVSGGSYGDFIGIKAKGSHLFSWLASKLLGIAVNDFTNAFRAFRKDMLSGIPLEQNNFAISPEMVIRAAFAGKRIEEQPTVYSYRQHGMSNFKVLHMGLVYWRMAIQALLYRIGVVRKLL